MLDITENDISIIQPWNAFIAATEQVSIEQATGRKAASTIRQYPPGIPEIIPGMTYSSEILNSLKHAHNAGIEIIGVDMSSDRKVHVISEDENETSRFSIQTLDSQNISETEINEVADFFRLQFCAAPYFHFAFHESNPLQSLPHTLDYDAYIVSLGLSDDEKREFCQNSLKEFAILKAQKQNIEPNFDNVVLPQGFHRWTDKNICREKIKNRLLDAGYVTLVRCSKTSQLKGLLHSRMATIDHLFQTEEWSDPLLFSKYDAPALKADSNDFFEKIKYHFGLQPNQSVMTISAQILTPDIQGGDVFYDMMRSMALAITPEHASLPLLCEIPSYGTAHTLNTAFTNRIIFGVLKNDHPLVFSEKTANALFPFISGKQHWYASLRKAVADKRHYRTHYFVPQFGDNPHVVVKPNGKLGLGVFATSNIKKGSCIAIFTGETYKSATALEVPLIMRDHVIQTAKNEFVFGYKGLAHCICHSCDPNCGIRERTQVYAVKDISKGEQITWDYRCSENSNWVLENCLCESERCTGRVGNFDSLPRHLKKEYLENNMVSEWLTEI